MQPEQYRQEMLCDFSASGDDALITLDEVNSAMVRTLSPAEYNWAPMILGVDVASGGDRSVIQPRQGLMAHPPIIERCSTADFADIVADCYGRYSPAAVFIDASGGYGDAVINRLRQLTYRPIAVQFGAASVKQGLQNKRVEMWVGMRDWLQSGAVLPKMPEYRIDLTAPNKRTASNGKLGLESKEHLAARGISSPDVGDALALTFAAPVHIANSRSNSRPAYALS
jgi:hypothetical protein